MLKKSGLLLLVLAAVVAIGIVAFEAGKKSEPMLGNGNGSLVIGAFNIQVFGQGKLAKNDVVLMLAKIASNFDVIAIEEIRDDKGTVPGLFLDAVKNVSGKDYVIVAGPRLGRTSSKEQYAYLYDKSKLELLVAYTYDDAGDKFHREPFVAAFRAKEGNFDFVLLTIHTDPDETGQEIADLHLTVEDARQKFPQEKDFIVMGDLNADCNYFNVNSNVELKGSGYRWLISDEADTTTKTTSCAYDRIIITKDARGDFAGNADVFRFDREYGLDRSFVEEVSDHYPVWARFYADRDSD